MTQSRSSESISARHRQLEGVATITLVVLGCSLLLASLLHGYLWALDDDYVGSGTGDIGFSERLRTFFSFSLSNAALSSLVLAAGVHLRLRMLLRDQRGDCAETDARADEPRTPVEVLESRDASHDMWRRQEP